MEYKINPKSLINVVKRYSALYDKKAPAYKQERFKIWHSVCRELISNWDQLKKQDKHLHVFAAQKRWKNLRTCYRREVAQQKLRKNNDDDTKRKVYHYYKYMRFLDDADEGESKVDEEDLDASVESSDSIGELKYEDIFETKETTESDDDELNSKVEFVEIQSRQSMNAADLSSQVNMRTEEEREGYIDEGDGDKHFLMSLMPTFRKFNDMQRFEARIEILKVLKDISFKRGDGPSS